MLLDVNSQSCTHDHYRRWRWIIFQAMSTLYTVRYDIGHGTCSKKLTIRVDNLMSCTQNRNKNNEKITKSKELQTEKIRSKTFARTSEKCITYNCITKVRSERKPYWVALFSLSTITSSIISKSSEASRFIIDSVLPQFFHRLFFRSKSNLFLFLPVPVCKL